MEPSKRVLIIAGTTGYDNEAFVIDKIEFQLAKEGWNIKDFDEVASGKAHGVDTIGENWAKSKGIEIKPFPANWKRHGHPAGFIRNRVMGEYATHLLAIWNGTSSGTKNMIDNMARMKKPFTVWNELEVDNPVIAVPKYDLFTF